METESINRHGSHLCDNYSVVVGRLTIKQHTAPVFLVTWQVKQHRQNIKMQNKLWQIFECIARKLPGTQIKRIKFKAH